MSSFCVVENLSLWNFLFRVAPFLVQKRIQKLLVVDATPFVFWAAPVLGRMAGVSVSRFRFRSIDIKDEEGLLLRLRIPNKDLHDVFKIVSQDPSFQKICDFKEKDGRWATFLSKSIGSFDPHETQTFFRAMMILQAARWQARKESGAKAFVFLNQRPWGETLAAYGKQQEVGVLFLPSAGLGDKNRLAYGYLRSFFQHFLYWRWILKFRRKTSIQNRKKTGFKLAVEHSGYFNLDRADLYSDFFFWQVSAIKGDDIVGVFRILTDPMDEKKRDRLNAHRMDGVVLDPRASVTPKAPPFPPIFPRWNFRKNFKINSLSLQKNQRRWVKERLFFYEGAARFWRHFLKRENIKVYVTWMKYDAQHCPLAEALRETGGVLAVFQRALDVTPFIETQVDTDIYFGYSKWTGEVERQVGSKIPYFIVTGYLGDHRFELLKPQAQEVREKLLGAGANHILSFTDEGSSDDARWYTDHAHVREDYAFLLEKILKNKHLGLVLKPKIPSSLRHRLGPLVPLLEEALKTGRCYLYEDGDVMGSYPPAVAALSADIAIHGYLSAPTASLETALAGVPTLLMDREGWHSSPLYALGKNKVIFNDWDSLWEAVSSRKQNREGNSPLGDWSPLIGEMDPFRDGRGAQRMGTYLHWMMEGFKEGWNRERVLAYAAEKYVKAWGQNKVISI